MDFESGCTLPARQLDCSGPDLAARPTRLGKKQGDELTLFLFLTSQFGNRQFNAEEKTGFNQYTVYMYKITKKGQQAPIIYIKTPLSAPPAPLTKGLT